MKALIITYYWPPAGGSGVQRWLKFVKYLQDFGVEPVVYTVKNAKYPIEDFSLEKEVPKNITVLKQPIFEPNNILSFFKKNKSESAGFLNPNPSFFCKILQNIRANYFIPDARKYWVKPSVKYLKKYLLENEIDVVITSGPPHSLHLIGLQLKRQLGVKWISDFRDPWTDIDYFHQLPLSEKSKEKHFELEKQVLQNSDAVLVVGKTMKDNYNSYSKNIHVISNGFDTNSNLKQSEINLDVKFTITHIGMMNADRNPKRLWKVLSELSKENLEFKQDLEVKLIGKIASEIDSDLEKYNLKVNKIGYVPHKKVQLFQQKSQVLLLVVNNVPSAKGIVTGKVFEYLQAKRPILAVGPINGDLSEILKETHAGSIFNFDEEAKLKIEILRLYKDFKSRNLKIDSKNIEQYHRKNLTQKLSEVIKQVTL